MVLGAGIYQVPLLETIRAMGHESLVCSIPGPYPGFAAADKAAFVNTVDQEAILALAKEEKIDGILTTGTDVAVRTIGYVCDALGLAGPSYRAACNVTDKYRMREAMKQGGVRCPAFARVYTPQEARAAAEEIGLPVIFKCGFPAAVWT
jgi:biotin carboxylase